MGLISAVLGAAGGALADSWKEFFYCEAIPRDVLVVKGQKRVSGRSSNEYGNDNIITSGSGIAVADGQCMIIVDQGKVVEVCAVPGEFTYDASTEPSILAGNLGQNILKEHKTRNRQLGLMDFQPMEFAQEVAALDVVSMTPLDALNKLFELNEKAKRI